MDNQSGSIYNVQVQIVTDGSQKWIGSIAVSAESVDIAKKIAMRIAKDKNEYTYGDKVEILFIYK